VFFDRVLRVDAAGKYEALRLTLYLKREVLVEHWNGEFLVAQLTEAAQAGHYAHCYFFGRLVPHRTDRRRLVVKVESLEHLTFTLRAKSLAQAPSYLRLLLSPISDPARLHYFLRFPLAR
jgi:hypothetical protein